MQTERRVRLLSLSVSWEMTLQVTDRCRGGWVLTREWDHSSVSRYRQR